MTQTVALGELCHHPFFAGMKEELLAELNDCTRIVGLQAGQYLGRTGQEADAFYLIASGKVAIEIETPQKGLVCIQTLDEGDVVGWSWLAPPHRWRFHARAVVLTVGTFLAGRIHIGLENYEGGRAGDPPANALSRQLREIAPRVGRLKTGTPPRIDGRTIDFSQLEAQPGDDPVPVFSFLGRADEHPRQISCYITHTNEYTHEIIRGGLDRSPMYAGVIEGVGPRYCPSIEDKVVRFASRDCHQLFLEPEGWDTDEVYPNGISTSLPFDVTTPMAIGTGTSASCTEATLVAALNAVAYGNRRQCRLLDVFRELVKSRIMADRLIVLSEPPLLLRHRLLPRH